MKNLMGCSLGVSTFLLLFVFSTQYVFANPSNGLSVQISSSGIIPAVSIYCVPTRNYTLTLIHEIGDVVSYSPRVIERKYCDEDGIVTFSEISLVDLLTQQGGQTWWNFIHTPLEYIIKDTSGGGVGECTSTDCPLMNTFGAFNNYDNSVLLASSTYWTTAGAGPIFDSTDHVTWRNIANGDGTANYTGFSVPPATTTVTGNSNVMFLPGFEGSRLYEERLLSCSLDCEDMLWEPNGNSDARVLFMNQDGTSADTDIYTRDVMSEAYGTLNIYRSFLDTLSEMKTNGDIVDYSAVPYDWRLPLSDILASGKIVNYDGGKPNISYLQATSSPYIVQELRRLAASSQNGKVTIVAHSNGGLLAKMLLKQLADANDPLFNKIDKLIFVAVPQLGTPSAITGLLHGYDQGIPFGIGPFASAQTLREFGQNLPGAYNFLPSEEYFEEVDTPVLTFDSTMPEWTLRYGTTTDSQIALAHFLADSYGRVAGDSSDTQTPTALHSSLLTVAEITHDALDNWTPPIGSDLELIEIAGWGIPTTVSGLKYSVKIPTCAAVVCATFQPKITLDPTFTIDGDGTVVTLSALWSNGYASTTRYWVDLGAWNEDNFSLGPFKKDHPDILEVSDLTDLIQSVVINNISVSSRYISTSVPTSQSNMSRLIYSLHSPLTLDIYDSLGNHTGISTTTGQLEEQIPGTYFLQFGEVKYIFTDTGTPVTISMSGYDTGIFTFAIQQLQGDTTVSTVTFQDIPTTPTTKVSMTVGNDINTLSSLDIDSDDSGTSDIILTPVINNIVTYVPSPLPPEPTPLPVPPTSSGGGPLLPNIDRNIHSEIILKEPLSTNTPIQIGSISTTTITKVALKRSDLKNQMSKGQTLVPKKLIATTTNSISQVAQVVSADPFRTSRFTKSVSYFLSLPIRVVNWSLSIFKRN